MPAPSQSEQAAVHQWKVARLSRGQLQDVRPDDVLASGWFRICETYRGGGGYDEFPIIAERRWGRAHHIQFVVQLFGCHLDCPYCYVTREGVWGEHKRFSTADLVEAFASAHRERGVSVFHLMGGAPALQLKFWPELIDALEQLDFDWVFHSDLLLTEAPYDERVLRGVSRTRCLFAVDVKGLTAEEHLRNTRKPFRESLFWENLARVEAARAPYYTTFTNVEFPNVYWDRFRQHWPDRLAEAQRDAFNIGLIKYKAIPYVDEVKWGLGTASEKQVAKCEAL